MIATSSRLASSRLVAFVACAVATLVVPARSQAQDTTRGVRIGLEYRTGTTPGVIVLPIRGSAQGDSVRAIVERDLSQSGRVVVAPLAASDLSAPGLGGGGPLDYAILARLGAHAVVQPTVTPAGLHVAVHDVAKRQVLQTGDFPLPASFPARDWRMAVHAASDEVLRWITGTRGAAATRIAFVRGGQLWVVDSDGAMETAIPTVGAPLSPAWHPAAELLAYNTFGRGSRVVLHDFRTGRARTVSGTTGVNQTPVFSPDGRSLVFSHTPAEGGDLYLAPVDGGGDVRKITVTRGAINVSPSFSPDGRRIAFTSSRAGHPEVYIMDADGTNPELLSPYVYGEQSYQSNPDFSPDGRFVAYQAQVAGRFQLKMINLRDRTVRQLTSEGRNEDPSWSPDGRHLVFTSDRSGSRQLWVLDVETNVARQLTFGAGGTRTAAWSPRLQVAR